MCYLEGFYKGVMLVGIAKGQRVEEAKPVIKELLFKEGLAITYYEPEGEVVSRSGDQCIVALKF
jgi:leucyl-tRNA synthetase